MSDIVELLWKEKIYETDYSLMIKKLEEIIKYDSIIEIPNNIMHEVSIISEILVKDNNYDLLLQFPTKLLSDLNDLINEETGVEYIIADVDCDMFLYGQLENRNHVDSLKQLLLKIKKEN
tara:strand:+ start:8 stop:367 length:360 start_codon:yes stop_codon:yes gene_type:complete